MTTATCSCEVVDHPSAAVWVAMTLDRTCDTHIHGQRWTETRGATA